MVRHLAYETCGAAYGQAALLLHGFLSSNLQWVHNRKVLGKSNWLILVEAWGHGRSPAPRDPAAYTAERYVEEIDRIRRLCGHESVYLIGHSFGVGVLTQYALAFPEKVAGIVATNSISAFGGITPEAAQRSLDVFDADPTDLPMHPANCRELSGDLRRKFIEAADRADPHAARQAILHYSSVSCVHGLAELEPPMLLINGIRESGFQDRVGFIRSTLDHIAVVDVDAGHSPNLERPDVFNTLVGNFIDRH